MTTRFALSGLAGLVALPAWVAAAPVPAHYLVLERALNDSVRPVFYQRVEMAAAPPSLPLGELEPVIAEPIETGRLVTVELQDESGAVVFRDAVPIVPELRGEFHGGPGPGGGWAIDGHRFSRKPGAFVVRLPVAGGNRLLIGGPVPLELDLAELAKRAGSLPLAHIGAIPLRVGTVGAIGSPANRVDLLVVGDGYSAAEATQFDTDVTDLIDDFFDIDGYAEYRDHVNVWQLSQASAESGADHPPFDPACPPPADNPACCKDKVAQSDPLAGTYKNTAFDGRYCAFNIHRLAVLDDSKVFAAAAAVPDWDHILGLINDATYGGSGGPIAVVSTNMFAVDVGRHEYGHSFTKLADEYTTPNPGFPPCSDVGPTGPPCEVNVTDETVRNLIKWEPWILPTTPVPTPPGSLQVGLFEGARYLETGMYRPRDTCLMNVLGVPFGEVCAQAYVLKLYEGGWGIPAGGIDPIEPGSESPPPGPVELSTPSQQFEIDVLGPVGGPPVAIEWLVDGTPAASGSDTFVFMPPTPGTFDVRVEVEDETPLVHPLMAGTSLLSSRQWAVTACVANTNPSVITLDHQTLTGSQSFQATMTAHLGPMLTTNGTNILVGAPSIEVRNDTELGGTFTAGGFPICP